MELLTTGNSAKLYCLNWLEDRLKASAAPLTILDLGAGTAGNFVTLLRHYPTTHYTGVEPSAAACAEARQRLTGLDAAIINAYAYDSVRAKLPFPQYDFVVSFSVMEHVYRRLDYLRLIRACLKPGGYALVNYDSGHFQYPDLKERVKNLVGPLLARLGNEAYYQSFVREADFRRMAAQAGLSIVEAKSFNTHLKGVYKHVPEGQRADFMERWLALEEWLNTSAGIDYTDDKAAHWFTRHFILQGSN